jgi:predicted RNase H-like nuclease (RuvC/YqgF family)
MSEVKLCNEMIDRLRAENQEYEMTIVEQDRELAQLKELLNQKRPSFNQELEQITRENDLLSSQLAESNSIIGKLHDQIKDLKAYTQVSRNETRCSAELQMQ